VLSLIPLEIELTNFRTRDGNAYLFTITTTRRFRLLQFVLNHRYNMITIYNNDKPKDFPNDT